MKGFALAGVALAMIGASTVVSMLVAERSDARMSAALAAQYHEVIEARSASQKALGIAEQLKLSATNWWCVGDGGRCFRIVDQCASRRGSALCTPQRIAYCTAGGCSATLDACEAGRGAGLHCVGVE